MKLLKIIILVLIIIPFAIYNHQYPKPFEGYFSQKGQDKFLNEHIFHGKTHGIFIEIGAHDGISFSNTYFFEKNKNWTGICIEPNPDVFELLKKNRQSACEQVCIAETVGIKQFLKCSGYMLEMYSGLLENYDPRHIERIKKEKSLFGGEIEIININCNTINEILKKYNIQHIDLLSIDVEGSEKTIINSIDFSLVTIDVIVCENNFKEKDIEEILNYHNYSFVTRIGKDDIYILRGKNAIH